MTSGNGVENEKRKCQTEVETILSCHVGKLCASEHTVWRQNVTGYSQEQHKKVKPMNDSGALINAGKLEQSQNTLTTVDDAKVAFALTTIDEARLALTTWSMKMLGEKINNKGT